MAVGKPCVFRVDYSLDGGREFGTVFINDKENVALASVANGWAKVRTGGAQQSPYYDDLIKAHATAEAKSLGLFSSSSGASASNVVVRDVSDDFDGQSFLSSIGGKGSVVRAVVEAATSSGSSLRVTLLPDLQSVQVMVAGIQCPNVGRRVAPTAAADGTTSATAQTSTAPKAGSLAATVAAGGGSGAGSDPSSNAPEPFSREARHFTELRILNRDVELVVVGVTQHGGLVASVHYPSSPGGSDFTADLATDLVKAGLAKTMEWSLNMMTSGAFTLREAERTARQSRIGLWHAYVPQTGNSAKLSDKFTGVVAEIASGDTLVVRDNANKQERRVVLSSIRAPRGPARDRAAEPWFLEGKEFLRQRLIGKEVSVSMEYNRKIPSTTPASASTTTTTDENNRVMSFGTVTITEKSQGGEVKVNNVAELLLVRGFAQVVKHRGDEERSAHYEELVNAEDAGKKGKKGMWSSKEPSAPRLNDVTGTGSAARAKQYLPFFQRAGKLTGIVEFVLGGSRLKIYIPKEGVVLAFSPTAVRCPSRNEPFAAEAVAFTRALTLQREVQLEVSTVDKNGTFLGSLRIPPGGGGGGKWVHLGVALLEAGLAHLHPSFEGTDRELDSALAKAQKLRVGIWEKEDPSAGKDKNQPGSNEEEEGDDDHHAAGNGSATGGTANKNTTKREKVEITVTDVQDANNFYVQIASQARTAWITEQLAGMALDTAPPPPLLLLS